MKKILSVGIFIILLVVGFHLASRKPLWNDEFFTQVATISQPYSHILLAKDLSEGNIAPLFYIQQKALCDVFHFQTPPEWFQGKWTPSASADIFLRILPVIWMSLFFALVFLYFSYRFNLAFGFFALFVAFSTPFLWRYWAEARPYGLWVLLTGCQLILFLEILEAKVVSSKKWLGLSAVQMALSLTCVLSFFQIVIVSVLLFLKERRWQQYVLLLAVPLMFIYYYKPHGPANDVIFTLTVDQMLRDNISRYRLCIFWIYPLMLAFYFLQQKKILPDIFKDHAVAAAWPFFSALYLMILTTVIFLANLKSHATGQGQYVVSRHIIFLSPVGIIGISYLAGLLWERMKNPFWGRYVMMAVIAGLLLARINKGF